MRPTATEKEKQKLQRKFIPRDMYIKVKVTPNSKKEKFEKINDDTYHMNVRAKAEKNQANIRVCNLLAEKLNIERRNVKIITGHHSPNKILFIQNL